MTKRIALLAAIISLVGISCEMTGYEKTKSGLRYKIFSGSDKKEVPVVVVLQVFATPLHVVADVQESDVFKFLPENVQLCSTTSILHNH